MHKEITPLWAVLTIRSVPQLQRNTFIAECPKELDSDGLTETDTQR